MGCAPSIHISESRAVYRGGKEAEDAASPAAPLPPGGPRLPHGPKTSTSPGSGGASLAELESRGGSGKTVRGVGRAGKLGPGHRQLSRRAGRGSVRGRDAQGPALWVTWTDARSPTRGAACRGGPTPVLGLGSVERWVGRCPVAAASVTRTSPTSRAAGPSVNLTEALESVPSHRAGTGNPRGAPETLNQCELWSLVLTQEREGRLAP